MRHFAQLLIFVGAILAVAGITAAQGTDLRDVSSPFQEEFTFKVGQTLDLNLRIDGIKWAVLKASAGDKTEWTAGKRVKTSITTEMENLTNTPLAIRIILLLEDDRGRPLERIELRKIKVGVGRYNEDLQKVKVDGGNLADTAKAYIFAEVE